MAAWMAHSLSCPLFSFSSWLQPEGHSRVCRVPPYLWLSALMPPPEARVKLSPAQTPAKPITASLDHRHSLSLQLLHSIHYAANSPSCSTLDSLFTPYICSSHMPTHSPCWAQLFIRSCRHSISHAAQTVSNQALIHAGHIKLPPMYSVVEVID